MKRFTSLFCIITALAMLTAAPVYALNLGTNITIPDRVSSEGNEWYGPQEDDEVEPDNWTGQENDLEGFFVNDKFKLTLVGGYYLNANEERDNGHLFFDVTGDIKYGPENVGSGTIKEGISEVTNSFGYDLGLVFNFTNKTYNLYRLTDETVLKTVIYPENDESNAWKIKAGQGELLGSYKFEYYEGLTDSQVGGLSGGEHNAIVLDLHDIEKHFQLKKFYAHYTMKCGNDNLMGYFDPGASIPEPSTVLLLGIGLLGMLRFTRKRGCK